MQSKTQFGKISSIYFEIKICNFSIETIQFQFISNELRMKRAKLSHSGLANINGIFLALSFE